MAPSQRPPRPESTASQVARAHDRLRDRIAKASDPVAVFRHTQRRNQCIAIHTRISNGCECTSCLRADAAERKTHALEHRGRIAALPRADRNAELAALHETDRLQWAALLQSFDPQTAALVVAELDSRDDQDAAIAVLLDEARRRAVIAVSVVPDRVRVTAKLGYEKYLLPRHCELSRGEMNELERDPETKRDVLKTDSGMFYCRPQIGNGEIVERRLVDRWCYWDEGLAEALVCTLLTDSENAEFESRIMPPRKLRRIGDAPEGRESPSDFIARTKVSS